MVGFPFCHDSFPGCNPYEFMYGMVYLPTFTHKNATQII